MLERLLPVLLLPALAAAFSLSVVAQEVSGGASAPAPEPPPSPDAAPNAPAAAATVKPPAPSLLDSFRKAVFSRAPQVILDETAASLLPPPTGAIAKPPEANAAAPDPNLPRIEAVQRAVAKGDWTAVGRFLSEEFADKPDEARQAWLHLLTSLAADPRQQARQQVQQVQQANASPSNGLPPGMPVNFGGNGQPLPPAFRQTQLIHPADVLALADIGPGEPDQESLEKLAVLLRGSLDRGERPEGMLADLEKGTLRLGGTETGKRLAAAKLLMAAGREVLAGRFLPTLEVALTAGDAERLNLLTNYFLGEQAADGKPAWLEQAWAATQGVLSLTGVATEPRQEALRTAMALAPRVQAALGEKWLAESFTTEPARGLEILATIGDLISRDRTNFSAEVRETNLRLQFRVVSTLLQAAPERAAEWSEPLTVLALNWQQEAQWSQERDVSTQRGPQMQYDPFGNVFFSNYDPQQQMQMQQQQRGPAPVPSGRLLDLRPQEAWLDRVEPSLRPAFLAQTVELFLKVNEPEAAFPLIESIAASLKDEGSRLASRFLDVWTEKHDPNAGKRRTNRYMYAYGYNPQSDGIPLTRSRQDRNLEDLAGWVKRLRALPVDQLDEAKIADAFVRMHSQAEVYRLEAMEKVFGPLDGMKPETLASLVQTMRVNLVSVWRVPKVQQDAKTNRTDKDIQAEILRGYTTAQEALEPALAAHPDRWELRLAAAAAAFDEITYGNSLQKDSDFTTKREEAFAGFQEAAALYAKALPELEQARQSAQVYQQWFYASLGACDLEGIKFEYPESGKQWPLIRAALEALPGETGQRHLTDFANALSTRLSAVQPELKHRYLRAGLQIAGDQERAREARELFDYYEDLVTEVQLVTRIDGPDRVGTDPFGVFVEIRHTGQIEREAGGFQKYLQNQQGGYYYNFGRPPVNYREKFEEAARQALRESFEVVSCTFHTDKIQSRGTGEEGWRVTPYAYFLLKCKGPQVDGLPALQLNLDFLDTSGFAVLPIASSRLPLVASGVPDARPANQVEIRQVLDERKAQEGILALEVRATSLGLVPPLEKLLSFAPGSFDLTETEDTGLQVSRLDAESEEPGAVSERLWNLTWQAKKGLASAPERFAFGTPVSAESKALYFRYEDADLAAVEATVNLREQYAKPGFPWSWVLGGIAVLTAGVILLRGRRAAGPREQTASPFRVPGEINALTVLGLLRRIRGHDTLPANRTGELDADIATLEDHYFGSGKAPAPDLSETAERWVRMAT